MDITTVVQHVRQVAVVLAGDATGPDEFESAVRRRRSTTGGVPMNLAVYIGQDLLSQWFAGDSTESWTSILDRFEVTQGRRVTRTGEETLEAQFRIGEDVFRDGDSIYITGEKDIFDFYNAGLKFVFRFK